VLPPNAEVHELLAIDGKPGEGDPNALPVVDAAPKAGAAVLGEAEKGAANALEGAWPKAGVVDPNAVLAWLVVPKDGAPPNADPAEADAAAGAAPMPTFSAWPNPLRSPASCPAGDRIPNGCGEAADGGAADPMANAVDDPRVVPLVAWLPSRLTTCSNRWASEAGAFAIFSRAACNAVLPFFVAMSRFAPACHIRSTAGEQVIGPTLGMLQIG
jgi:hypothetical protein